MSKGEILYEWQSADDKLERLPELAAEIDQSGQTVSTELFGLLSERSPMENGANSHSRVKQSGTT